MMLQNSLGVILPFPKQRLSKRRRVQPPPLKRVRMGVELRAFIERMARKGAAR